MDKNIQDCMDSIEEKLGLIMDKLGIDVPDESMDDSGNAPDANPRDAMIKKLTQPEE